MMEKPRKSGADVDAPILRIKMHYMYSVVDTVDDVVHQDTLTSKAFSFAGNHLLRGRMRKLIDLTSELHSKARLLELCRQSSSCHNSPFLPYIMMSI